MKKSIESSVFVCGTHGHVPEFSPIENIRWSLQDDDSFRKISDINLLQNMDRIRKYLGEDTYRSIVISMSKSASRPSISKDGLTDTQLLDTTPSRYMQSSSERRAVIMDLTRRYQGLIDNANKVIQEHQQGSLSNTSTIDGDSQSD